MRVLHPPVAPDVGEQVFRRGVVRAQAGEVEDGLGPGVPPAFLLVRDVPLDEQGLARVLEAGAVGGGQDADGAGLDPAAADLAGRGGDGHGFPGQRVQGLVQVRLNCPGRATSQCASFALRTNRELSLFACMASAVMTAPGQRQRREQRLEVADLVGLPGFRDPVLGDHYPREYG